MKRLVPGQNDLATTYPELASEWHPEKNGDLTPKQVTAGSNRKVWWLGTCGHEWAAVICSRSSGCGCPTCEKENKTSFPEKAFFYYVKSAFADAIESYRADWLGRMELDMFIPSLRVAIEYDGQAWHDNLEKDLRKGALCAANEIRLIRIREPKCPPLDAECIVLKAVSDACIESAIKTLLYDYLSCSKEIEVNISRDRAQIFDLVTHIRKERSLLDFHTELATEWHPTKNGNFKPEHISHKSNKKVWWQCQYGHEWADIPNHRSNGRNCPYCSGKRVLHGFNDLQTKNPELAAEWHHTKNGKFTPAMTTLGSGKKVWWICDKGHEWEASIASRARGNGCPYCAGLLVTPGKNDLATVNPELAAQWHPIKNGATTTRDVISGSGKKYWWICNKGHEWEASCSSRMRGNGCPICAGRVVLPGYNDLQFVHPELAKEWHPIKNGDLTPKDVAAGTHQRVWWQCEHGHEWKAQVRDRAKGRGCPVCTGRKVVPGFNDLASAHPHLVYEWHPTKNGDLRPDMVTPHSNKVVWWLCTTCGNEWQTSCKNRSAGKGCSICAHQRARGKKRVVDPITKKITFK